MRRVIFATTLILFPVLASAQASTSTESKQYPTSAEALAELNRPAGLAEVAVAAAALGTAKPEAKAAIATGSINSAALAGHPAVLEFVQTRVMDNFTEAALRQGGTLEFSMKSTPAESSAPKVTRTVEVDLSPAELAETPAVSRVVVRAVVDENGVPRNVAIAQSAGPVVDRKAVEAVSRYRFQPATEDNQPTWSAVSIAIKIQKQ
jgi:TonB family protein